jgi:hypothetical protein
MEAPPTERPETLGGYRLIRFIGRGGFGEEWLCRSEAMGDYRALKWIPSTSKGRLEKEYESLLHYRKTAAALRSPSHVICRGTRLRCARPGKLCTRSWAPRSHTFDLKNAAGERAMGISDRKPRLRLALYWPPIYFLRPEEIVVTRLF